ncbi:MAG TPA: RimK family alpha-L-glutamate ligase [Candidatus Brocadiia bacterium]|nr:RimK family alpha-L-glutamate ligase [Candidatus Brocadiia bacterium]
MRIIALSGRPNVHANKRLREAARQRGHQLRVMAPFKCVCRIESGSATIYYYGRRIKTLDVAIPRISVQSTDYGVAVMRHFKLAGFTMVNDPGAVALSRDKMRSLQELLAAGLPVPRTFTTRSSLSLDEALVYLGGWPVVVKVLRGTQGVGVALIDSRETLESFLQTVWSYGDNSLIQEYIPESLGSDVRVVVVGGKAVAAIRRKARLGDFRSNYHRGGDAEPVELTPVIEDLALRSAGAVGLDVAGVDLLESRRGLLVNEVNSSPGFEAAEAATGIDVAGAIIEYAERLHADALTRAR